MENVNFEWNDFGLLTDVISDGSMVYITNSQGIKLKMSIRKYKDTAQKVKSKSNLLIGQKVQVRTSKNTADWSSAQWFSDIAIAT